MPTLQQYQAGMAADAPQGAPAPQAKLQVPVDPQSAEGSDFCVGGKHYLKDSDKFVEVGDCDDPKHQVVNAAQQMSQAAQGKPQEGAALSDGQASTSAPSQILNKILGTGDKMAAF